MTTDAHGTSTPALPVGRAARGLVGVWLAVMLVSYYGTAGPGALAATAAIIVALLLVYMALQLLVTRYLSSVNRWLGAALALLPAVVVFFLGGLPVRAGVLTFVALSLMVAAVRADPGCEVMSLPALFSGSQGRLACVVFSPIDFLEAKLRGRSRFGIATILCFLLATNGFDVIARVVVGQETFTAAARESLLIAAIQPIGTLLLLAPFVAVAWLSLRVGRKANGVLASIFFGVFMAALGWFYFWGYWGAQHAMLQEKWTAAALSVGMLPFTSVPVVLLAAVFGGLIAWKWGRAA